MKEWLNQVVQICVTEMALEQKRELIQKKQQEFEQFDEKIQNMIRELFRTGFDARDSVYILSVFVTCAPEFIWEEELMQCILREKNYTYAENIMMEYQVKYFQLGKYGERKTLRKKSVDKLKQMGLYSEDYIPLSCRNQNRVVIITEQLLNIRHSPTLVVYNNIYYLRHLGYEVMVFVCPCDAYLQEGIWYHYRCATASEELHGRTVVDTFKGEEIYYYQINLCGEDCVDRYYAMIEWIRQWNPLFVYEIGLLNAIGDTLAGMTTVVSEMLSIKDCSVSNAQIIVRMEENEREIENEINENLECCQTQLWVKEDMPICIVMPERQLTRKQLDLPEDKFLIAVVGNRLDLECGTEFVALLKRMLQNNPMIGIVIIGETKNLNTHFSENDNIYFIGYQEYLQNVYDILDLYLNPVRAGGGYSSQMAMQAGLPVVTMPGGDVAYMTGEDFIVTDYEEMYATVEKYVQDEVFRREQRERARQRGMKNSKDTRYMERKIHAIKEIIRLQENGKRCSRYTMSEG